MYLGSKLCKPPDIYFLVNFTILIRLTAFRPGSIHLTAVCRDHETKEFRVVLMEGNIVSTVGQRDIRILLYMCCTFYQLKLLQLLSYVQQLVFLNCLNLSCSNLLSQPSRKAFKHM